MARVYEIMELANYIRGLSDVTEKATVKALLATSVFVRAEGVKNASKTFTGRNDRTLTGTLMNNIFSGLEAGDGHFPDVFLGVRGIPYGAIHEFGSKGLPGGKIKPVKAQKLWIPNRKAAGNMTPRQFMDAMKSNPKAYYFGPKMVGMRTATGTVTPLFFRVDSVTIPERPYLRPAMEVGAERFGVYMERFLSEGGE